MKVVINCCYGGFSLSKLAYEKLGLEWDGYGYAYTMQDKETRTDPKLIQVVEELGESANGRCADLHIVWVPDDVEWVIEDYDGYEHVSEKHRTWYC